MISLGVLLQLIPALSGSPAQPAAPIGHAPEPGGSFVAPLVAAGGIDWSSIRARREAAAGDTARTRRSGPAIEYSGFYHTRLTLHRWLSFAMLPLFAGSYFTGHELLEKGDQAPGWARHLHGPLAAGTAVVFSVNTITGAWNLWDSRKDPAGRLKRYVHSLLFVAAGAGFVYAASKADDDAAPGSSTLKTHRDIALVSMGLSVSSWALMLFFK